MFPIVFLFICFICINSHIPRSGNHTEWWERHQPAVRPSALWSCFCSTQSCDCLAESLKLQIPDLKTKAEKVLSNIKRQGSYTGGSGQWKAHHFGPGQHEGKPLSVAPPTTAHGTVQIRNIWLSDKIIHKDFSVYDCVLNFYTVLLWVFCFVFWFCCTLWHSGS